MKTSKFDMPPKMNKETILGMELDVWRYKSCAASFGTGPDWATLYDIQSLEEGNGHATGLLKAAKAHYESCGLQFGGSTALNTRMKSIYKRLKITEYA